MYALDPIFLSGVFTRRVQQLVDTYGWDNAKKHHGVRTLLQKLGKEGIRDCLGPDTLVQALDRRMVNRFEDKVVITDVRFENEVEYCQEDGIVIWIDNPKCCSDGHISENDGLKYLADYVVENNGTIEELHKKILDIVDKHQ